MAGTGSKLFRLVQEKKKAVEEKKRRELDSIPYVITDCISDILIRLPLESLQRLRFVCKPWYKIINTSDFIDDHLSRSDTTLIFLSNYVKQNHSYSLTAVPQQNPNIFSIEDKLSVNESFSIFKQPLVDPRSKFKMQYMGIKDGEVEIVDYKAACLGQIRSSCNGLIVLDNMLRKGGLIALNPVNRKMTILPLGTIWPSHKESYTLSFCKARKQFKLVHLFMDELKHVDCELLDIGTKSWRAVDGPSFALISSFGYNAVHAIGAVHWLPHMDHSENIVSLSIDNEKFHKISLPKSSGRRDRIVEIRGLLGFVTHEETNQIDVWVLRGLFGEEWTKEHTIIVDTAYMVPFCCTKVDGNMVFRGERDRSLYVYDFRLGSMTKFKLEKGLDPFRLCCIPHVNSLISWDTYGEGENMI